MFCGLWLWHLNENIFLKAKQNQLINCHQNWWSKCSMCGCVRLRFREHLSTKSFYAKRQNFWPSKKLRIFRWPRVVFCCLFCQRLSPCHICVCHFAIVLKRRNFFMFPTWCGFSATLKLMWEVTDAVFTIDKATIFDFISGEVGIQTTYNDGFLKENPKRWAKCQGFLISVGTQPCIFFLCQSKEDSIPGNGSLMIYIHIWYI